MIIITLPSGKTLEYENKVSGFQVAADISVSLRKIAIAMVVDDKLTDLSDELTKNSTVRIITTQDPEGLEIIRHDAAHCLAQAIKILFPKTQITIGPVIENGFYYDLLPEKPLSLDDLEALEKEMTKISNQDHKFIKEIWDRNDAIKFFHDCGEHFKAEIIEDIPGNEKISVYRQGDFIDLCRGPHAPSTKFVKHFKLMKIAGAYWRGDHNNVMLQRIYGTAWTTKEALDAYLLQLEEAEKRDHRKLGKALDLFHIQEESPGMVFWHHKGHTIYNLIKEYIRRKLIKNDYIEVKTPTILDLSLWEKSGHWEKFGENMFVTHEKDKRVMAIKPMNCPCHIEIFKKNLVSYRDLPIRMAEFGCCHRNEPSGSLHGLMRVREFVQDDAHIFCRENQIKEETSQFIRLLTEVYHDMGFANISIKFSDRPSVRAGSDATWDKAETSLKDAIDASGIPYSLNKGEGAFYGPKLEFVLKDAIGRDWQCGTLQVDFILPERLGASYIDDTGHKQTPVILHRAILGSLERFIGMLIEQHEGKFPLWLAPVQVAILTITSDADQYAKQVKDTLFERNIRAIVDLDNDKINYKIRKHSLQKVPLLIIVGKEEVANKKLAVRSLGSEEKMIYNIEELIDFIKQQQRNYN